MPTDSTSPSPPDSPRHWTIGDLLPPHLLTLAARGWELGALGGHALRVAAISYAVARSYGLHERICQRLRHAAAFHDIGKMMLPQALLTKPGGLTPDERQLVQNHTVYGYQLLLRSDEPTLREAAVIAYCHHERVDGRGYPRQRAGGEIPLSARIVSVADVFDALTSDRSYRPALSEARALELLREGHGRHFDAEVVTAFLALLERQPDLGRRLRWFTQRRPEPADALLKHTRADAVALAEAPAPSAQHVPGREAERDDWVGAWLEPRGF